MESDNRIPQNERYPTRQKVIRAQKLENTEISTHLISFESDDWHVTTAKNLEEESKLLEAGFEFIRYSEKDEVAIYRKRK